MSGTILELAASDLIGTSLSIKIDDGFMRDNCDVPPPDVEPDRFVRLLRHQAGVTVTPGTEFAPGYQDSIRLNFSQGHAAAFAATERIVKMVEVYRK